MVEGGATSSLATRLGDIPGVASVNIDLDGFGRGIDVRLEPGADEIAVMEQVRALLAAYGVRRENQPRMNVGPRRSPRTAGVEVKITRIRSGARIEVIRKAVKSFRIVAANPLSMTQGLADAWCQVIGRIPIEIVDVALSPDGLLEVTASDGEQQTQGTGRIADGWQAALVDAVAGALGNTGVPDVSQVAS